MADTIISDAVVGIQDEGLPNISDGNEDWGSAGLRMMLAQAVDSDSYVRSDSELTFTNHDSANDQVDVTAGVAYLDLTGETVNVQSGLGGSSPPAYDTALPTLPAIPVIAPTTTADLDVQDATLSSVWIAYATDSNISGISAGDIYYRSDDTGSVTAPPHPNVEIGQANPDNASADTLLNRFGSPTFADIDVSTATVSDLSVSGVDSDLHWSEDANSPKTVTGSTNASYTVDTAKDQLTVFVRAANQTANLQQMDMRVNGDSGSNYNQTNADGSTITGASEWQQIAKANPDGLNQALLVLNGQYPSGSRPVIDNRSLAESGFPNSIVNGINNGGLSSPITSIEFLTGSNNHDFQIEVYGRDIQ